MRARRASQTRRTLVDTSAYFALLDADDANHAPALTIRDRLIAEGSHLFTTSFVLAETHALLLNRSCTYSVRVNRSGLSGADQAS
jgi:predicted nucleic acid-binding protein